VTGADGAGWPDEVLTAAPGVTAVLVLNRRDADSMRRTLAPSDTDRVVCVDLPENFRSSTAIREAATSPFEGGGGTGIGSLVGLESVSRYITRRLLWHRPSPLEVWLAPRVAAALGKREVALAAERIGKGRGE
jgi:hypothetical protein